VHELAETGRRAGVKLAVENNVCRPGQQDLLLLHAPDEFRRLLETTPADRVGVLLDTGHLSVSSQTLDFDPQDFLRAVEGRVLAVHLHDNDGVTDLHRPAEQGSWALRAARRLSHLGSCTIVESKFPDVASLAAYATSLQRALSPQMHHDS
jgi:sugar phosphate isomerase/epimerase